MSDVRQPTWNAKVSGEVVRSASRGSAFKMEPMTVEFSFRAKDKASARRMALSIADHTYNLTKARIITLNKAD
jgi:hypothetical protein